MRTRLTQAFVDAAKAKPEADRTVYWHEGMPGFGLMVTTATGHKSYVYQYRAQGISRRATFPGTLKLSAAIRAARKVDAQVREHGKDPVLEERKQKAEAKDTFRGVAQRYLDDPEGGKKLRSRKERERIFKVYLYPQFGARQIESIGRKEISNLIKQIRLKRGPVMAAHVLAVLRKLMNWHAADSDTFRSPIVKGMNKTAPVARARVLDDTELQAVWRAAEGLNTPYGHMIQFILLTAARLREAARMNHVELTGNDWLIPAGRHKSKREHLVPLSQAARDILTKVPVIGRKGWVFTLDGQRPINGFSKCKAQLDKRALEILQEHNPDAELQNWVTHDLRRTAKSLMSRAGVPSRDSERSLGHVIVGVEGTYDRHAYVDEKRRAFEALAAQIERILNPRTNVVSLRA